MPATSLSQVFNNGDAWTLPIFLPIGIISVYRFLQFLVRFILYLRYKPIDPSKTEGILTTKDVSIIVPTINAGEEFQEALRRFAANNPYEIIVVTTETLYKDVVKVTDAVAPGMVKVYTVKRADKRTQLNKGINKASGSIVALR